MYNYKDYIRDIENEVIKFRKEFESIEGIEFYNIIQYLVKGMNTGIERREFIRSYTSSYDMDYINKIKSIMKKLRDCNIALGEDLYNWVPKSNISESVIIVYLMDYYKTYPSLDNIVLGMNSRLFELYTKENPHRINLQYLLDSANNGDFREYITDSWMNGYTLLFYNNSIVQLWISSSDTDHSLDRMYENTINTTGLLEDLHGIESEHIELIGPTATLKGNNKNKYGAITIYQNIEDFYYAHPLSEAGLKFDAIMRDKYNYRSDKPFTSSGNFINIGNIDESLSQFLETTDYGRYLELDRRTLSREFLLTHDGKDKFKLLTVGNFKSRTIIQ